eukprot:5185916-Pyramimonas_sp.AAC.1
MFAGLSARLRAVLAKKLDEIAPQLISDSCDLKDLQLFLARRNVFLSVQMVRDPFSDDVYHVMNGT